VWEEEFGPLTENQREFIRELELLRPGRFIGANLRWSGIGRLWSSRESLLRAFRAKGVYDFPTTKMLIENLSLYDLENSACDAPEIHEFSRSQGHVPVIDPHKRRESHPGQRSEQGFLSSDVRTALHYG
jgi:hypothetical protein